MATTADTMPQDEIEPMVSAAAIARLLGVHPNWVRRHADAGDVPGYRLGRKTWRFRVSEVLAWAEANGPQRLDGDNGD